MELGDYGRHLRRNWILILVCISLGLLSAGAASAAMAPVYKSTTKLFVAIQNSGSVSELQQGNNFSQQRVQSYAITAATPLVLQPVVDSLALPMSAAELGSKVAITAELNTVVLTITASDESPERATAIARGVGQSLIEAVDTLETAADNGKSPLKLTVVTPADIPSEPASPNTRLNLAIGFIVGLALGIGLAVLRTILDTKIRGEADVRRISDLPVLGGVPFDNTASKKPLIAATAGSSPRAESFRQLRTNLQFTHVSNKSKTVLVTSSVPGEGKTSTSLNLGMTMAQSGQSVVVVDADLRRPRLAGYLGMEHAAGLTTALIGKARLDDLLQPYGEHGLHVLTSGQIPPNPSELLGSDAMKEILQELEARFDVVIIDAPPLLPVTDAAVLSQEVGGVLLVVGARKARIADVKKAISSLQMVNAGVLGVVLNRMPSKGPDAHRYGYGTYGPTPRTLRAAARKERQRSKEAAAAARAPRPVNVPAPGIPPQDTIPVLVDGQRRGARAGRTS